LAPVPPNGSSTGWRFCLLGLHTVLAEAGAWPSAPRVVLQGYLLNEAPRTAFEAWLRSHGVRGMAAPKARGAPAPVASLLGYTLKRRHSLAFFLVWTRQATRAPPQMAWSPVQLAAARRRHHLRPSPARPCARTFYTCALLTHINVTLFIVVCALSVCFKSALCFMNGRFPCSQAQRGSNILCVV